jgi:CheY-like chemotaxis protein
VGTERSACSPRGLAPDLVLLDLMLPIIDGYQVAERLRRQDKEMAIIMVTALDQERDKVRGLDAGATTTSPSRSRWRSCSHACGPTCAGCARARPLSQRRPSRRATSSSSRATSGVTVAGQAARLRLKEFQLLVALAQTMVSCAPDRCLPRRCGATSTCPRRARSTCTSGGCARRSRTRASTSTSTPCTAWATASSRY